jgi:hypothetical protein
MVLQFVLQNTWMLFCIFFAAVLIISSIMKSQESRFVTRVGTIRKFSILDLEFPSSGLDLANNINGIYKLPENQPDKVLRALKNNLFLDFLFMPAIYGCIFLLCMYVAGKTKYPGNDIFAIAAWLQFAAWLFDIIENCYLLYKIRPGTSPSKPAVLNLYRCIVIAKWAIALFGGVCAFMVIIYFFITGNYQPASLGYLKILVIEVLLMIMVNKFLDRRSILKKSK